MSDYFTCPRCGGHDFGRDTDGEPASALPTVRCHGAKCGWRGEWPPIPDGPVQSRREIVGDVLSLYLDMTGISADDRLRVIGKIIEAQEIASQTAKGPLE